jgi:hypothetical protein
MGGMTRGWTTGTILSFFLAFSFTFACLTSVYTLAVVERTPKRRPDILNPPIYPGVNRMVDEPDPFGTGGSDLVSFTTPDGPDLVLSWYDEVMRREGWLDSPSQSAGSLEYWYHDEWTGSHPLEVTISASVESSGTLVTMVRR